MSTKAEFPSATGTRELDEAIQRLNQDLDSLFNEIELLSTAGQVQVVPHQSCTVFQPSYHGDTSQEISSVAIADEVKHIDQTGFMEQMGLTPTLFHGDGTEDTNRGTLDRAQSHFLEKIGLLPRGVSDVVVHSGNTVDGAKRQDTFKSSATICNTKEVFITKCKDTPTQKVQKERAKKIKLVV